MTSGYTFEDSKATEQPKPNGRAAPDEVRTNLSPGEAAGAEHHDPGLTDDEIIQKAFEAKNGAKFKRLWQGHRESYKTDDAADSALCAMLAYWTGRDPKHMDRLFRRSGLMRPKWDTKIGERTYGQEAIQQAIANSREVYAGVEEQRELQHAREKVHEFLEQAKATRDITFAFQAAAFIAQLPAVEAGPVKAQFKAATGGFLNLNDLGRAISEAARDHKKSAHRKTASGLQAITITDRPLREVSDEALTALYQVNKCSSPPNILVRANKLVRVTRDETNRPLIQELSPALLRGYLTRSADFIAVGASAGEPKHKDPPENVLSDILTRGGWLFPPIEAIAQIPILRSDGTILSRAGYDTATRLIYLPPPGFRLPAIPDKPSQQDIQQAKALVDEAICDFPFVDKASKANTLALMLTLILRQAVPKAPLALIDAPDSGTGKSLLAEILCVVTTGQVPAMMTECENEAEWGKAITSVLLEGSTINIIDNVEQPLKSAQLAALLTAPIFKHRILGRNEQAALPSRATWIATGNNIALGGDLPRRCYLIRMDAEVPWPYEGRTFKHPDLRDWITKNQGQILGALFTLARSWFAAGKPLPKVAIIGGFEDWTRTIGGILEHIGVEGFLENRREVYDQSGDDEEEEWRKFVEKLSQMFPNCAFATAAVFGLVRGGNSDLYDILPGIFRKLLNRGDDGFTKALGKAFAKREGHKYGIQGWRVERAGERCHAARWRIVDKP